MWKKHLPNFPRSARSLSDPFIIHYAAGMIPTKVENNRYALDFWNVARKTPCYESILNITINNYSGNRTIIITKTEQNILFRKIKSLCWRLRNQGIKETWIYAKKYIRDKF